MLEVIVLTGGDPNQVAVFNYFFSLMANMAFIFVVPYVCLRIIGGWTR